MEGILQSHSLISIPLMAPAAHEFMLTLYNRQVQVVNQALNQVSAPWHEKLANEIKPFAHLSTRALLDLLENALIPLQKRYAYFANQSLESSQKVILEFNHQKLEQIKQQIYQGLRFRCTISGERGWPRQVDDLEAYVMKRHYKQVKSITLDDDSRIIIYDLLLAAGFDKKSLFQEVMAVVPKRSYQLPHHTKSMRQAILACNTFIQQVAQALHLQRELPKQRYLFTWFQTFEKSPICSWFTNLRYPFYFALSLTAYYLLWQTIGPVSVIFLSKKLVLRLSYSLFYTIGLLPLWMLGMQYGCTLISQTLAKWRSAKTEQIVDALYLLEQSNQFINHRLRQVIVDITHHDFDLLHNTIQAHHEVLKQHRLRLQRFTWQEVISCSSMTKIQVQAISHEMSRTQEQLAKTTKRLIKHIINRVKEELMLLQKGLHQRSVLVPVLPVQQYSKIKNFIRSHGAAHDLALFESEANLTHLWLTKWHQFTLPAHHDSTLTLQQPWGGHVMRHDVMQGWQLLLEQLNTVNLPSKRALSIHGLLRAKQHLSLTELRQAIATICKPEEAQHLLEQCQLMIFNTLSTRPPHTAALLAPAQKALIATWYHGHVTDITRASRLMKKIFNHQQVEPLNQHSDEDLARCYELLEGADIYHYAHGMTHVTHSRHNLARRYFEAYRGESSLAFRLLKFIPRHNKEKMLEKVANKRLTWLLDHKVSFDEVDIELFMHHKISMRTSCFSFAQTIRKHLLFSHPWSRYMERFLKKCQNHGLDSGKLLIEYQAKNHRIKTFLLQRTPVKAPVVTIEKINLKGQRYVRR